MICLVTDRRRLSAGADDIDGLVDLVAAGVRAGIDLIQVRERDLDTRALVALVRRCVAAAEGSGTKILVNDRADVAFAAGAHGVHLRGDSIAVTAAQSLVREGAIIGRSVHSADEARAISRGGVAYLIFGTLYQSASKDAGHPVATLDELRTACRDAYGVPVLAIGGITVERAAGVARAGAAGIAGIGLFVPPAGTSADRHLHTVVGELRRAFDTCGAVT
jgi:thiamine-phosphate pyrophosphorylase